MRRKIWAISAFISILIALVIWIIWGNTALTATYMDFESSALPPGFDGFRIVQLSDTHDAELGPDNADLVAAVAAAEPDIIVITGDIIDSSRTDIDLSVSLAAQVAEIAPTYYVNGNHEALISDTEYARLISGLESSDVTVLNDTSVELSRAGDVIRLVGIQDTGFIPSASVNEKIRAMQGTLAELIDEDGFSIVLAHRPELIASYAAAGPELVLCGHAHGGQFRLPILGGLIAPGQGILPDYDSGLYEIGETSMIVSRGIGNSIFPFRFNNRPEIVVIDLIRP